MASYVGRTMPAIRAADAANVRASKPSSQAGWAKASVRPTSDGAAISTTLCAAQVMEFASAMRSRPTSIGRAPKTAPSKNTPMVGPRNATTRTCGTVTSANRSASGSEATTSVLRTSAVTITFLRFQRSVRAPEKSPKSRYGAASHAATSAVRLAEPLVR